MLFSTSQTKHVYNLNSVRAKTLLDWKSTINLERKRVWIWSYYFISFFSKSSKNGCFLLQSFRLDTWRIWSRSDSTSLLCGGCVSSRKHGWCDVHLNDVFVQYLVINVYLLISLFASWLCMFLTFFFFIVFILFFSWKHGPL
jgi:hypothetical protein